MPGMLFWCCTFPCPPPTSQSGVDRSTIIMVCAGQASRTTLLEGVGAVAGDVAQGGASYKNEIEADLAIRCFPCTDMYWTLERSIVIILNHNRLHVVIA